jgi:hypothetical protein
MARTIRASARRFARPAPRSRAFPVLLCCRTAHPVAYFSLRGAVEAPAGDRSNIHQVAVDVWSAYLGRIRSHATPSRRETFVRLFSRAKPPSTPRETLSSGDRTADQDQLMRHTR